MRFSFRTSFLVCSATTAMLACFASPARAIERALLGIHIYSNVKTVLRHFGNPTYVLTGGQTFNTSSNTISYSGTGVPGSTTGAADDGSSFGSSIGSLPPMQPEGGPVQAFGQAQMPGQDQQGSAAGTEAADNGEVTLVYQKPTGVTYEFLLSTHGSVVQITALGYSDPLARTTKAIHFGSTYTQLINRYGYPENQSETNGVRIVDYSTRAHVAFELVDNQVVGIVVAAVS